MAHFTENFLTEIIETKINTFEEATTALNKLANEMLNGETSRLALLEMYQCYTNLGFSYQEAFNLYINKILAKLAN